jgi:hypothetical protein
MAASGTQDALHFLGASGRLILEAHSTERQFSGRWAAFDKDIAYFIAAQWYKASTSTETYFRSSCFDLWDQFCARPVHQSRYQTILDRLRPIVEFLSLKDRKMLAVVCPKGGFSRITVTLAQTAFRRVFEILCSAGLQQAAIDIRNSIYGLAHLQSGKKAKSASKGAQGFSQDSLALKRKLSSSDGQPVKSLFQHPVGIVNGANNCWLNASLQCLLCAYLSTTMVEHSIVCRY